MDPIFVIGILLTIIGSLALIGIKLVINEIHQLRVFIENLSPKVAVVESRLDNHEGRLERLEDANR